MYQLKINDNEYNITNFQIAKVSNKHLDALYISTSEVMENVNQFVNQTVKIVLNNNTVFARFVISSIHYNQKDQKYTIFGEVK